jgi:anti-sigma factor RsiW
MAMSEHVERRLTAYHDGALDRAESESVRLHLDTCAACRSASEEHLRFEALLDEATAVSAQSRSLWPGVKARLEPRRARLTFGFAGGMAAAAVAGVVLSLALPARTPTATFETDPWQALGYGVVDGTPTALAAFDLGVGE